MLNPAEPSTGSPQVLVVGAGPVGLTLAHELLRRGVRVRVVDAAEAPATTSRAIATHPRTLETYDQMGVVDEMLARGQRIQAFTLHHDGRRLARLDADYTQMPTRYPFTLCIDQVRTEEVLHAALCAFGVAVEWGVRCEDFEQDADGVDVTLGTPDGGRESVRVGWLAGCDGGHSTVRKKLAMPLLGKSSDTWLIADADIEVDLPRNSIHWVRSGGVTLMMVPMSTPGRWRLLDTVSQDGRPAAVAERFSRELSRGLGRPVKVAEPVWVSVFTFQQRMIESMRSGRVLLAGDAAHVHSPASGQGMNTGVQEAFNLGWKLAMVLHGQADARLLDSYSRERVPIGRALLQSTKGATFLVQLKNALAGVALPVVFSVVRAVPALRVRIQRKVLGGVSGLRVGYPDSPLTGADTASGAGPGPGVRVASVRLAADGDPQRTLVDQLRRPVWTLFTSGAPGERIGALAESAGDWLETRALHGADTALAEALGLTLGGWSLVRPDGYVSARGTGTDPAPLAASLAAATGRSAPPPHPPGADTPAPAQLRHGG
ncbi:FAD-dependent oxidoreductase [Streptomyces sp. NPDC102381]|uniref:FAD-dependent oxidoreductase n=1 Tax=Streptomyces sp. NPDC102381 TaxID=3366164 RepID=UPI003815D8B0